LSNLPSSGLVTGYYNSIIEPSNGRTDCFLAKERTLSLQSHALRSAASPAIRLGLFAFFGCRKTRALLTPILTFLGLRQTCWGCYSGIGTVLRGMVWHIVYRRQSVGEHSESFANFTFFRHCHMFIARHSQREMGREGVG